MTGEDVVQKARSFIGTKWHHQARLPGVAMDCGGVVVCAAQALLLPFEDHEPGYGPMPDGVKLRAHFEKQCTRITEFEPGAIALFRWSIHPQHVAVISRWRETSWGMIHCWAGGVRKVTEHEITPEWEEKLVRDDLGLVLYRLPGVDAP
jgi:hypothetical protein